jgi:hypothetical protein
MIERILAHPVGSAHARDGVERRARSGRRQQHPDQDLLEEAEQILRRAEVRGLPGREVLDTTREVRRGRGLRPELDDEGVVRGKLGLAGPVHLVEGS